MHRTGIEPLSTAWKAAMLSLHQRCWKGLRSKRSISELSNMDFSLHIFRVSHQEKTKNNSLGSGVFFSLTILIRFSLIESCRFCFVTSQGFGDSKRYKNLLFLEYFVPFLHTIVKFNLSLKLNFLLPVVTMLRRLTIEEINFRTIKHGFFLTHFPSVTARKNQKKFFEKRSIFFAKQNKLF